ncbi:MAG TPA: hypothetical protein VKD65_15750 [Candidatus Angelobacter sp.]|nr:hypothetical protein [Candidatus Angelobacter sp.]
MSDPITPYLAGRARGMLAILILAIGGLFGYAVHQHSVVNHLSAENNQIVSLLKDTRTQMAALTSKLDSATAQPVQQASLNADVQAATPPKQSPQRRVASKHHRSPGDSRFKRIQTQLDAQGKAIESTRQELASTRADLGGSIARTHDELVVLQKKGERNYYEFDLDKSKQFQRTGPVGISLRKANTKHMYADLELRVDDADLSKKHVNLFEPVFFYLGDEHRAVELVINNVRKNHIHGYISAPKYSASELSVASGGSASPNSQSDSTNQQRRKLEVPR